MHLVEYRICLPFTVEEVSLNILNEPLKNTKNLENYVKILIKVQTGSVVHDCTPLPSGE